MSEPIHKVVAEAQVSYNTSAYAIIPQTTVEPFSTHYPSQDHMDGPCLESRAMQERQQYKCQLCVLSVPQSEQYQHPNCIKII